MRFFKSGRGRLAALALACCLGFGLTMAADEPVLSPLADATDETRALVAKAVLGYGGESQMGSVNVVHVTANIVQADPGGEFRMTIESLSSFPDRHLARIRTAQGTMTLAIDGAEAYLIPAKAMVRGAAIRLTSEERDDLVRYFVSDPLFVLRNRKSSRFLFAAGEVESVGPVECRRLHVYADGMSVVWLVDPATGRIVRADVGEDRSEFGEWKVTGPVTVPHRVTTTRGGRVISKTEYALYETNPRTIDVASRLRKPDLWLMRWKVQPRAGGSSASSARDGSGQAASEASKSAATYRPPVVAMEDSSVVIWDPGSGTSPN